jgi:hypothetical protein
MAISAQLLVERGAAKATSNEAGKGFGDAELLARLSAVYLMIYTAVARQRPDEFSSTATLPIVAGPPIGGAFSTATPALTDVIEVLGAYGVSGTVGAGTKIHIVPEMEKYRSFQITPTMSRRGLALFSRFPVVAGDPTTSDVIQLIVLDTPPALTTLATNIDARFPQRHHEILVNLVALYLEIKDNGPRIAALQADLKMSMMVLASEANIAASAIEAAFFGRVPAVPAQAAG